MLITPDCRHYDAAAIASYGYGRCAIDATLRTMMLDAV